MKTNAISRMNDKQVVCRSYGHAWAPRNVTRTVNSRGRTIEYRAHLECSRGCGTVRTQILDAVGDITGSNYKYGAGYRKREDEMTISRRDARNEFLSRVDPITLGSDDDEDDRHRD